MDDQLRPGAQCPRCGDQFGSPSYLVRGMYDGDTRLVCLRCGFWDEAMTPMKPPSNWQPIQDKGDLAILGKFAEELAECGSAVARCIIQGVDGKDPGDDKPNRQWLTEEVADVLALAEHVMVRFGLDRKAIAARQWAKIGHKKQWLEMLEGSKDCLFCEMGLTPELQPDGRYVHPAMGVNMGGRAVMNAIHCGRRQVRMTEYAPLDGGVFVDECRNDTPLTSERVTPAHGGDHERQSVPSASGHPAHDAPTKGRSKPTL